MLECPSGSHETGHPHTALQQPFKQCTHYSKTAAMTVSLDSYLPIVLELYSLINYSGWIDSVVNSDGCDCSDKTVDSHQHAAAAFLDLRLQRHWSHLVLFSLLIYEQAAISNQWQVCIKSSCASYSFAVV